VTARSRRTGFELAFDAMVRGVETALATLATATPPRYCYMHGWEIRRDDGDYYRICAECNHTYLHELAVLQAHWAERGHLNVTRHHNGEPLLAVATDAEQVTYCPLCGTDWPPLRTENPAVAP
jgi:hypothetical protein